MRREGQPDKMNAPATPKTVIVVMPDGERIPLPVEGESGLPVFDAAAYVLIKRRPRKATGTMIGDLGGIAIFMDWAAGRDIDLDQRIRGLRCFSTTELVTLAQVLRCDRRPDRFGKVVSNTKWRSRIDTVCAYLDFEFSRALHNLSDPSESYATAKTWVEDTLARLRTERPAAGSYPRVGLEPNLLNRLIGIIKPNSPDNPWIESNRTRNYAIMLILCCLGLRLGELLSLRLIDVQTRGGSGHLDVRLRPVDPRDTRRLPPTPKTLGRRLPLLPLLSRAIDTYILGARLATSKGRRSEYLILAKDGSALSPRAAQQMVQQLAIRHPEFSGLCAHQLRNTNSDIVQQALRESALNNHQASDIHTYIGGWAPGSVQPARYSQRWLSDQADKISLAAQTDVLGE